MAAVVCVDYFVRNRLITDKLRRAMSPCSAKNKMSCEQKMTVVLFFSKMCTFFKHKITTQRVFKWSKFLRCVYNTMFTNPTDKRKSPPLPLSASHLRNCVLQQCIQQGSSGDIEKGYATSLPWQSESSRCLSRPHFGWSAIVSHVWAASVNIRAWFWELHFTS